ncbi:phosphoglucosamine mutase [Candidatus Synechococcus calcipolaris G9]|uniref:Phosphoglucosamine mutase n=1 Tax=Candidatus Synechococcus calcipolaris G9 TaxID=1497997 RepID=A0ABT6F2N0_9SYNE|nr:phosphoglucosamine mutase [Candidatus Synechococcus calcipolaris]MDG2992087.1 phosphoglucosamine mutase [Candidatus Synechococcus calcipolaris G9]
MNAAKATPIRFGTDGIRGRAGELLTPTLALQLGYWAGRVLQEQVFQEGGDGGHPFILGQDSRNSSDMLAVSLAAGLTAAGLEVWHVGLCPTPCIAYLTQKTAAVGGAMISASHNPPEDNGIKIFGSDGSKLAPALQKQLEAHLNKGPGLPDTGTWGHHFYRPELLQTYRQAVQSPLDSRQPLQGLRVVLDLAWGAAVAIAPDVFRALGAEVICLHDQANGDRINVDCGSTHLGPLQTAVSETRADLGFAFDGDADRVLAVDSLGRTVDGDHILYFWGQTLQRQRQLPGDLIVATVMSNLGFERAWQQTGGQLVRAAVGDQYVHAEMIRHGAMLGGEQSGHILCRHYGVGGDGLLTAVHLATLVQDSGQSLQELRDASFQPYPQILRNVRVSDRQRRLQWQDCEPVQGMIEQAIQDMGDRGRVLVRASGTEPVIRVMVEAATDQLAEHWTQTLVSTVETHLAA